MKKPPSTGLHVGRLMLGVLAVILMSGCVFDEVAIAVGPAPPRIYDFARVVPTRPPEAPQPTVRAKVAQVSSPRPTRAPRAPKGASKTVTGMASTYGAGYDGLLALPTALGGRGERVRICSVATGRCVTKTSNDVGPVARLHRVADLDAPTFDFLCRCNWRTKGIQKVAVTFL